MHDFEMHSTQFFVFTGLRIQFCFLQTYTGTMICECHRQINDAHDNDCENTGMEHQMQDHRRTQQDLNHLAQRHIGLIGTLIYHLFFCLIAEEGGVALGYAYAGAFKGRPAYDWAVEVTAYVKMDFSGHGVSTLLYTGLERCLSMQNIINLNACITYPNEKSEAFHRKLGYKTVAHFTKCGYKSGAWKDMIWMEKFLCAHPAAPAAVIPFPEVQER